MRKQERIDRRRFAEHCGNAIVGELAEPPRCAIPECFER
jgi:hypothetical protein